MSKWYYLADGQEVGPLESADLKRLADSGRLKPHDTVRRTDMTEWYQVKQVKGLFTTPQSQTPPARNPSNPTASSATPPPLPASAAAAKARPTVPQQASTSYTAPVIASTDLPTTASSPSKKEPTTAAKVGGCGCLLFVLLMIFAGIVNALNKGGKGLSSGGKGLSHAATNVSTDGTVKSSIELKGGVPFIDNLKFGAQEVAGKVYEEASSNPSASKVEVTISLLVLGGVQDKFGNALDNPFQMGVLVIDGLDEVRKYRDADTYRLNPSNTEFYKAKLGSMLGAHLLK